MGKQNKEKRAAKRRDRVRRGPTPPRGLDGWQYEFAGAPRGSDFAEEASFASEQLPPPVEALTQALLSAAGAHLEGDPSAAGDCAAQLGRCGDDSMRRSTCSAAGMALSEMIGAAWQAGWLPADLWEMIRRHCDVEAAALIVDSIAANAAQYSSASLHERWEGQLDRIGASVWWDSGHPHLGQWAHRRGISLEQAVSTVITVLAELMTLPELPRILPLPGQATRSNGSHAASHAAVDQKVLGRVRSLLAKAESTQFPDEAEALSAKAQEMMNRHAFDRALLDAETHTEQSAMSIRLWLDSPYQDAKAQLVAAIAEANRCKSVFYHKIGFVALVGEELDLEITELLTMSLLVQATHAMVAHGSQVTRSGQSRTRSFRRSFLLSYAIRIGERLKEATAAAHDPDEDVRLLPVLADRSKVVEETYQAMFSHVVHKRTSVSNGAGWQAGRTAANHANLSVERSAVEA